MDLRLRTPEPSDIPALIALSREAFGSAPSAEEWSWKYEAVPFRAVSMLAELGGLPFAFFGAWATRYRGLGGDLPGLAAVDVMTGRAARALGRHGVFRQVALRFFDENGKAGAPFVFGFPNDRHRATGERLLDYVEVERCGAWEIPVGRVAARRPRLFRRLVLGEPFGRAHAPLEEALHARPGWRTDRSPASLNWRFFRRPGVSYVVLQLLDLAARSRGYAVLRTEGPLARLVDLQVRDEGSGDIPSLVEAAGEAASRAGSTVLVLRAPRVGTLAERLVGELGFSEGSSDCSLTVRRLRDGFDVEGAARGFDYRFADHDVF